LITPPAATRAAGGTIQEYSDVSNAVFETMKKLEAVGLHSGVTKA
jgi:hypothetical protein